MKREHYSFLPPTSYHLQAQRGQSLIELLVGIALGTLFISGAIGIIVLSLRIGSQNKLSQTATELTHELATQIPVVASADWHELYDLSPHGTSTQYYLVQSGGFLEAASGTENITVNSQPYVRWFAVSDVYRDASDVIVTDGSGTVDPSSLHITVTTAWVYNGDASRVEFSQYVTRNRSRVFNQTDWSGGPGDAGPYTSPSSSFASASNIDYASTAGSIFIANIASSTSSSTNNIDATDKWAWNDVIGWIDMSGAGVSSTGMTGYASSGVGFIAFDCNTSPTIDCDPSYGVSHDGAGILSGYAWNDAIGWINFQSLSGTTYGVTISSSTGEFSGFAWNDVVGWFSFNCADLEAFSPGACALSNFKTTTLWSSSISAGTLTSSIFDTSVTGGAGVNTILWQGTLPTGTTVKFQIAVSNSVSGPWEYLGPDGTTGTYYQPAGPDVQTRLIKSVHNNYRYLRYHVTLESNAEQTDTPIVDNIILGWSL